MTVSNDDNEVKVKKPVFLCNWIAAFCEDSLADSGSSWCFQCGDPTGIWFGLALRESVPKWPSDSVDVTWNDIIAIGESGVSIPFDGLISHGKDATKSLPLGPVRLNMEICGESLFLRVNDGPVLEMAKGLGEISRWTPYVSFPAESLSGVKIK